MSDMKLIMEGWRNFKELAEEVDLDAAAAEIAAAHNSGPAAVRAFLDTPMGKDPKVRKLLNSPDVSVDGASSDDSIGLSRVNVSIADLIATQSYIDIDQSVAFPLGSASSLLRDITTKKGFDGGGKKPITISGKYIIDGHHRWSGIFSTGGQDGATILATNIDFPGGPEQKLASAQLAIGAIDPNTKDSHPSKGGSGANVLGAKATTIYSAILSRVNKSPKDPNAPGALLNDGMMNTIISDSAYVAVLDWAGVPEEERKDVDRVRHYIAQKVARNLEMMKGMSGAPHRPDMPQLDHPSIGGDKALKKIKKRVGTSRLNVVPPFKSPGAASAAGGGGEEK